MVQRAFRAALSNLRERLGPSLASWRWGRLHRLVLHHTMGGKQILADLVNLPTVALPGELDTVWKAHFDIGNPADPFKVIAGPVHRMIVDLADIERAWWISDTGASGWPRSPHYGDQHTRWARGEYVPMLSDWKALQKRAQATLRLQPAGSAP
jgi:penicillin amidase